MVLAQVRAGGARPSGGSLPLPLCAAPCQALPGARTFNACCHASHDTTCALTHQPTPTPAHARRRSPKLSTARPPVLHPPARRFSQYPQELVLRLEAPARLTAIQLLAHEFKIPAKVELVVGTFEGGGAAPASAAPTGGDPSKATWRRLGFVSFDSNQHTGFTARELKSAALQGVPAHLLRISFARCHANPLNLYSQVGSQGEWDGNGRHAMPRLLRSRPRMPEAMPGLVHGRQPLHVPAPLPPPGRRSA